MALAQYSVSEVARLPWQWLRKVDFFWSAIRSGDYYMFDDLDDDDVTDLIPDTESEKKEAEERREAERRGRRMTISEVRWSLPLRLLPDHRTVTLRYGITIWNSGLSAMNLKQSLTNPKKINEERLIHWEIPRNDPLHDTLIETKIRSVFNLSHLSFQFGSCFS